MLNRAWRNGKEILPFVLSGWSKSDLAKQELGKIYGNWKNPELTEWDSAKRELAEWDEWMPAKWFDETGDGQMGQLV